SHRSFFMQKVQSDILTHRGSHFDLGIKTAQWMQQTPMLKNREKEWKKRMPRFDINIKETYDVFQMYAPQIWEEIKGMQEVLNLRSEERRVGKECRTQRYGSQ